MAAMPRAYSAASSGAWQSISTASLESRGREICGSSLAAIRLRARSEVCDSSCGDSNNPASCSDRARAAFFGEYGFSRGSWQFVLCHRRSGRRHGRAQYRLPRSVDARAQEREATVKEIADLVENLNSLKRVIITGYRAVGPEMRDRVDRLYDRVIVLQQSADRALAGGSRIPNQLTATLRSLQREHGSLENIVRLAMEAAPTLSNFESEVSSSATRDDVVDRLDLEDSKPKAAVFQSLIRESALRSVKSLPKYIMSSPASQGSSPLAAFRAEIERRVMEQLANKRQDRGGRTSGAIATLPEKPLLPSLNTSQIGDQKETTAGEQADEKLLDGSGFQVNEEIVIGAADPSSVGPTEYMETALDSTVTESLSRNLVSMREEIMSLNRVSLRADVAENRLQQLELDLAKSIPLGVHEQMVRNVRNSLSEARLRVLQITGEVREKEAMLEAVKKTMLAEQEKLVQRVRELTGDIARRVSVEEMEAAISHAVGEVEKELEMVQHRAISLSLELEKKEILLVQQQEEWRTLREGLEIELKSVKGRLASVQKKRTMERAQLLEAQQKVKILEQELTRVRESVEKADRIRAKEKESSLVTVRLLIAQMIQSARAKERSDAQAASLVQEVAKLQEENESLELTKRAAEEMAELAKAEAEGVKSSLAKVGREVENLQGALSSGQRISALENFFAIMAQLIKQESEKIDNPGSRLLEPDWLGEKKSSEMSVNSNLALFSGDGRKMEQEVKHTVILQYETSWEWAYLHFKADDSGWTEAPGVLMQNCVDAIGINVKVLTIQASTVEFVLNDGKGVWDGAPGGGNYHISEPGTYQLSAGQLAKIETT